MAEKDVRKSTLSSRIILQSFVEDFGKIIVSRSVFRNTRSSQRIIKHCLFSPVSELAPGKEPLLTGNLFTHLKT